MSVEVQAVLKFIRGVNVAEVANEHAPYRRIAGAVDGLREAVLFFELFTKFVCALLVLKGADLNRKGEQSRLERLLVSPPSARTFAMPGPIISISRARGCREVEKGAKSSQSIL